MDFMPKSTPVTSRVQAQQIITGKRPNHHRPGSPIATSSSSYSTVGSGCIQSPAMSSEEEEEEDMANCLIMLAHSVSPINDDNSEKVKIRSVTEMADGENLDIQSYECKTCNRTFPSFQALGGHRASHKKPKLTVDDDAPEYSKDNQPRLVVTYEDNKPVTNKLHPIQTGNKSISQPKVHQCSICGSEFLSGQALGGHMRRHRPASISPMKPKLSPEGTNMNEHTEKSTVLSLDLNLPPPEVVDDGHSKFQFAASSSQQPLVFSAAALVDCHY